MTAATERQKTPRTARRNGGMRELLVREEDAQAARLAAWHRAYPAELSSDRPSRSIECSCSNDRPRHSSAERERPDVGENGVEGVPVETAPGGAVRPRNLPVPARPDHVPVESDD